MPVKYISMPSEDFMLHKWRPPTFRSISQLGVVKFLGPYHFMKRSGSVQAFQSNSRGASNLRLTTICPSFERSIFLPLFPPIWRVGFLRRTMIAHLSMV